MPVNHQIDNNAKIILTTWEGEANDIDFIKAIKTYQEDIQSNPNYFDYNEVVNLSKVSCIKLTTEGIKKIGEIASSTDKGEVNKKLAIVVSSNLTFGLARMYEAYRSFSKHATKKISVFKNENEAFEWLQKQYITKRSSMTVP